jgi:hypothetical protein
MRSFVDGAFARRLLAAAHHTLGFISHLLKRHARAFQHRGGFVGFAPGIIRRCRLRVSRYATLGWMFTRRRTFTLLLPHVLELLTKEFKRRTLEDGCAIQNTLHNPSFRMSAGGCDLSGTAMDVLVMNKRIHAPENDVWHQQLWHFIWATAWSLSAAATCFGEGAEAAGLGKWRRRNSLNSG